MVGWKSTLGENSLKIEPLKIKPENISKPERQREKNNNEIFVTQ